MPDDDKQVDDSFYAGMTTSYLPSETQQALDLTKMMTMMERARADQLNYNVKLLTALRQLGAFVTISEVADRIVVVLPPEFQKADDEIKRRAVEDQRLLDEAVQIAALTPLRPFKIPGDFAL